MTVQHDGKLDFIEDKTGGRLGRNVVSHDPRNRAFPARGVVYDKDAPLKTARHRSSIRYNQDVTSECSPHAGVHVISRPPFRKLLPPGNYKAYNQRHERTLLYKESQRNDPWPEEYYDGTSTDAPFRVFRNLGQIAEWRWNFGVDDVLRCLAQYASCSIGIVWRSDMMDTDDRGFIHWSGAEEGGHAVCLDTIVVTKRLVYVEGPQSWEEDWGAINGRFRMTADDLDAALRADGESVTVVMPKAA